MTGPTLPPGTPDDQMNVTESMTVSALESIQSGLSPVEAQILDFERDWWHTSGAKEDIILQRFDMSATRYYQQLNSLINKPAALEADPVLVRRLLRMRQARQEARSGRRAR
jgi:hypothetical protein